jgi:hypothetical protein
VKRDRDRPGLFFGPAITGAVDLGGDAGAVVAPGDGEVVAGLLVHPEPGPGAKQAHESVACGALILQSVLQIPIKRLIVSPAGGPPILWHGANCRKSHRRS